MSTQNTKAKLLAKLRKETNYGAGRIITTIVTILGALGSLAIPLISEPSLITILPYALISLFFFCINAAARAIYDAADAAIQQRLDRHNDELHAQHQAWHASQNTH